MPFLDDVAACLPCRTTRGTDASLLLSLVAARLDNSTVHEWRPTRGGGSNNDAVREAGRAFGDPPFSAPAPSNDRREPRPPSNLGAAFSTRKTVDAEGPLPAPPLVVRHSPGAVQAFGRNGMLPVAPLALLERVDASLPSRLSPTSGTHHDHLACSSWLNGGADKHDNKQHELPPTFADPFTPSAAPARTPRCGERWQ